MAGILWPSFGRDSRRVVRSQCVIFLLIFLYASLTGEETDGQINIHLGEEDLLSNFVMRPRERERERERERVLITVAKILDGLSSVF